MKTKIRLAKKTVRFLCKVNGKYRFSGIGSDHSVFEIAPRLILNLEFINLRNKSVSIVTPEQVAMGLFDSITFTREIDLPK